MVKGDSIRCIKVTHSQYVYTGITPGKCYTIYDPCSVHADTTHWVRLEEDDHGSRRDYLLEDFELASVQEIEDNIDWSFE